MDAQLSGVDCQTACSTDSASLQCARLPESWRTALTGEEQEWIGRELFQPDSKGRTTLTTDLKLWWYPPQPRPTTRLTSCLLRMSAVPLDAPASVGGVRPTCCNKALTKCGLYRTIRRVLDIDGWYLMATEYLECRRCKKKVAAWSQEVVGQLGEGHRAQFPAILTYKALRVDGCRAHYGWLLLVYCHDILSRLEDVKARVTSIFGTILKMDSTKRVNVVQ
ncbi:hypothetical protein N1851_004054 [Merluccius polli]|uniref:DUF6729 domain-containing protein n=1 Tax=Merluccius polli TaxID=89951 RepID=A0AA47PBY3_MERPO|nr:hypothetical protein N1851_004054 [Merluccius polli]